MKLIWISSMTSGRGLSNIQIQKTGAGVAYQDDPPLPASDLECSKDHAATLRVPRGALACS